MENAIERINFLMEQKKKKKKKKKKSRSVPILNLNVYLEHPFICISFFFLFNVTALHPELHQNLNLT